MIENLSILTQIQNQPQHCQRPVNCVWICLIYRHFQMKLHQTVRCNAKATNCSFWLAHIWWHKKWNHTWNNSMLQIADHTRIATSQLHLVKPWLRTASSNMWPNTTVTTMQVQFKTQSKTLHSAISKKGYLSAHEEGHELVA